MKSKHICGICPNHRKLRRMPFRRRDNLSKNMELYTYSFSSGFLNYDWSLDLEYIQDDLQYLFYICDHQCMNLCSIRTSCVNLDKKQHLYTRTVWIICRLMVFTCLLVLNSILDRQSRILYIRQSYSSFIYKCSTYLNINSK